MLMLIVSLVGRRSTAETRTGWFPAALLFAYAIFFSFAYVSLDVGSGALILFGTVQATLIVAAIRSGERPPPREWVGFAIAIGGLFYLVSPGLTAPSLIGSVLMASAGIAWGLYTLKGRGVVNPLAITATNFTKAVPFTFIASLITLPVLHISPRGIVLAILSGALASALGYVVWYASLKELTFTRAATVQLSVPAIAAAAGIVFLSEPLTLRLSLATVLILGGVGLAVTARPQAMSGGAIR